jgi:hypothetical protein
VLGWDDALINSPAFTVILHLGSVAALLVYFWRDLWRYAFAGLAVLRERRVGADPDRRMAVLLAASVIPAAIIGVLLEDFVDTFFREQLLVVCGLLVVGALILFVAERPRATRARCTSCACATRWPSGWPRRWPCSRHQPLGHHHLGRPAARPRAAGGRALRLPDGHADHRRRRRVEDARAVRRHLGAFDPAWCWPPA